MLAPVLRTKIIPPPCNIHTLSRPRVTRLLQQALEHRLTILQAGAGYGKSTALADFAQTFTPLVWYQVNQEDNDPLVFLLHLNHAIRHAIPDLPDLPIEELENWDAVRGLLPYRAVVDQTLNALSSAPQAPLLLIIDDAHLVTESGEVPHLLDRLIGLAPAQMHTLLAGRPPISLPTLPHWRGKGEVLMLDQSALAFNAGEIALLFEQRYRLELKDDEIEDLLRYTEGWAIALQLIWQNIRPQVSRENPASGEQLRQLAGQMTGHWSSHSAEGLFEVLTREVLDLQPEDVRDFLLVTACLRQLSPEACDALRGAVLHRATHDSAAMLAYLRRQDLFVTETGGGTLHYHPIFHDFLRQQSPAEQLRACHQAAAGYFLGQNEAETALYHLQEAHQWAEMADVLDSYADTLLAAGRLDTLHTYLACLPPEMLQQHPELLFILGDLARLRSRFDEARGWYEQAENAWRSRSQPGGVARALRGQARVYLDTVNPTAAERLLEEALRLSDGYDDRQSQVRLYELLAENKLNSGQVEQAEHLRKRAEELRLEGPINDTLLFRVLLRTGRLNEARQGLEALAKSEQEKPVQMPRAHRETLLLLSLVYSFLGLAQEAYQTALEGTKRGEEFKSPFVAAVGSMRQGHALNLLADERAQAAFQHSVEISRSLSVPRLRVEANWGLCRFYGFSGDLRRAEAYAQEGIEIASQAGDEWIASLVRLAMGASLCVGTPLEAPPSKQCESAEEWLQKALRGFQECSDLFGRTAAQIWLSYNLFKQKKLGRLAQILPAALNAAMTDGYDFLFLRPSLLGPPDERMFIPLLLYARQNGWETNYINRLLGEALGLAEVELHPGYQLRLQTLGSFQIWLGKELVPANAWRREKARQLLQLLITYRKTPLNRDQICEYLWPEADPASAQRNFKVTLNALYQVLEPERDPGSESAFIVREDSAYALRPGADIWLDAEEFVSTLQHSKEGPASEHIEALAWALELYQGEYLPRTLYETWAAEERERLATLFLENSDQLAAYFIEHKRYAEAIDICQRILAQDNCWERAYRYLMLAYDQLGDHGRVARTYQRCVQTLRAELDVPLAPETEALYQRLVHPLL